MRRWSRAALRNSALQWPHYNETSATFTDLALSRLRTLLIFGAGSRRRSDLKGLLTQLDLAQGSRSGPAVVLGAGPSANRLTAGQVEYIRTLGGALFAMNGFSRLTLAESVRPDYWVLADPAYYQDEVVRRSVNETTVQHDLAYLSETPELTLLIPHEQYDHRPTLPGSVLCFNFSGLEGISTKTNPVKPRGYSPLTALAATAIALHLGYQPVALLGLDFSYIRSLVVDDVGVTYMAADHAYDSAPHYHQVPMRPHQVLADVSRCLRDFDLFRGACIVNWGGEDSLIDAFPRASPWAP